MRAHPLPLFGEHVVPDSLSRVKATAALSSKLIARAKRNRQLLAFAALALLQVRASSRRRAPARPQARPPRVPP